MNKFNHMFHLVSLSPWPLLSSLSLLIFLLGVINLFNFLEVNLMILGYMLFLVVLFQWWRDVIRESTFQGNHTFQVLKGLRLGMLLFILSEVMFFMSFFWTYFHMYLSPSLEIGMSWYIKGIFFLNPFNIPLLNTLILLSSGVSITLCHYLILKKNYNLSNMFIIMTILLGLIFIYFQYLEYMESFYTISDSVCGSIFYMITGFHGFHVIVGVTFIMIIFFRLLYFQFSSFHHFGFEAASWYWHFVDVVWLFLYFLVYYLSF